MAKDTDLAPDVMTQVNLTVITLYKENNYFLS